MNTSDFFNDYFNNAEINSLIVMECDGTIMAVNKSFTHNFGYTNEEITGQNFNILFTSEDKSKNKPQQEIENVLLNGQAPDENFVVDREGNPIWCTGEALLVTGEGGKKYIVKDVVNLQAKKQLQLFLMETEELLERIFESSNEIPMMILDGSMKIEKVNKAFLNLFELTDAPPQGHRVSEIDHSFWKDEEIKMELVKIIVANEQIKNRKFQFDTKTGIKKIIRVDSKVIERESAEGKKVFLIMAEDE